ncbi:MAG TPA: acyl-CoA carboxylase subunit beta, partial [Actinomycetota bacterium]|nr:acyl-CoA carboxylase subunit beta [Actinomycetota bacterium]
MTIAAKPSVGSRAKRALGARGRIDALCDEGSFQELETRRRARPGDYASKDPVAGDGVVVGWGMVRGRPTAVVAHDFAYAGGSIGAAFAQKVTRIQRLAMERRIPIVYLNDSGGARIHEGIDALNGCGEIMALNVRARRVIPQISVIMGPCAGAAAYSPALTDWTIMVGGLGQMFLTGPEVVRAATGEQIDPEELGGATLHTKESGVAHFETPTEEDALGLVRQLLGYVPQTAGGELPERLPASPLPARIDALPLVVPASARATYDMRDVIGGIVDASVMLEMMAQTAPSLLTGFARIEGSPVGIVANQPRRRGGILDAATAVKGARFVSFCGRFRIPIVTLVDVPGFMPGSAEEKRAVITHGASLLAAYVEADSPKLTVIVRKAYGGAYIALGSRALGADMSWAWPDAEIAVMGPEAAVGLLHRRELSAAGDETAARAALAQDYRARITTPLHAAGLGLIDDIIE